MAIIDPRDDHANGRSFRISVPLDFTSGQTRIIKFSASCDFRLTAQKLVGINGDVAMEPMVGASEATSFPNAVTVWGKNRSNLRPQPVYASQVTVSEGGTVSGGQVSETLRVKTSNATAQQQTVGDVLESLRELPAGTYFLRFTNKDGSSAASVIFALEWEEIRR